MTSERARVASAVSRLRAALEHTAAALATPRVDALLVGEEQIERALAEMPMVESLSLDERQAVRDEIESARHALLRCRRLGAALDEFVRISLHAQGRGAEYGPRMRAAVSYAGRGIDARV